MIKVDLIKTGIKTFISYKKFFLYVQLVEKSFRMYALHTGKIKNIVFSFIYLFMVSRCIKWFVFDKVYWSTIRSILHLTVGQI